MKLRFAALAAATALFAAPAAHAQSVAALVGDNSIAMVDAKSGKVTGMVKIEGLSGRIIGIDVRPADGQLYAVAADGTVATVDPKTGKATVKVKLEKILPEGVVATVDFNPVPDKLRIMGSDGTSLRADVDKGTVAVDGSHKYADADANKGKAPKVVAGAYINAFKGAKETALYNIDAATASLVKQAPPNDGVLNTVGAVGVDLGSAAMDVMSDGNGGNTAFLMAGETLYTVDVTSGKATKVKKIEGVTGAVRDIAILPAM